MITPNKGTKACHKLLKLASNPTVQIWFQQFLEIFFNWLIDGQVYCAIISPASNAQRNGECHPPPPPSLLSHSLPERSQHSGAEIGQKGVAKSPARKRALSSPVSLLSLSFCLSLSCSSANEHKGESIATKTESSALSALLPDPARTPGPVQPKNSAAGEKN